jgi:hypothetical protein
MKTLLDPIAAPPTSGIKVALISCTKRKRNGCHPAKALYDSPMFRLSFDYADQSFHRVYILSAKHGLLDPDTPITPYDTSLAKMSKHRRHCWAEGVNEQIRQLVPLGSEIHFFCGRFYREDLLRLLNKDYLCHAPIAGLSFGRQLRWYKSRT